ncbi:RadC family protein [Thalassococcus sp. BH17M4-6]|uniref:RadC family protein n=1 Tax=Thalassococcus sp. BH17M4-6 TaxID=3413148 RepID=UPI003BBEA2B8
MSKPRHFRDSQIALFAPDEAPAGPEPAARQPSYIRDHRARLRERFMVGGADALPDYELLELVLFRAIPRRDVKPLARQLIEVFGDFNHVLSAPPVRLAQVPGVGEAVVAELKIVEAAAHRLSQARVLRRDVISSWDALISYCQTTMAHRDTEQFRVLYLDRKNVLIADELQARGTVDHVPVYPREVVKRALELNASALILVHNHPSGDPTPSTADIDMTGQIDAAARALDVTLHDHLIVGKSRHLSFRSEGLL